MDPRRVLLIFPPLSACLTHPELGLPQLASVLRASGYYPTLVDLNAELLYGVFRDPHSLTPFLLALDPEERKHLAVANQHIMERLNSLQEAIGRNAPKLKTGISDIKDDILRHMVFEEVVLKLRASGSLPNTTPTDSSTVARLLQDSSSQLISLIVTSRLASVFEHSTLSPSSSYSPQSLVDAVEQDTNPFDSFLTQRIDKLLEYSPRLVGLSIHATNQLVPALRIARFVRERMPETAILIGGPWCRAAHDLLLQGSPVFNWVDGAVPYEADAILPLVCQALSEKKTLAGVPGVLARTSEGVIEKPPPSLLPLDSLPAPDFEGLPMELYPVPRVPFRTIRGCYWGRCTFCYHVFQAPKHRSASPSSHRMSARMLATLSDLLRNVETRYGIRQLTLADNATPPTHLEQIANMLLHEGHPIRWQALARFDEGFTPERCSKLAASGCVELGFGLETADASEWSRLRKGINRDMVVNVLYACREAGIAVSVFLLDYPSPSNDSEMRLAETLSFVQDHASQIDFVFPLRFELGRNTVAYQQPRTFGIELMNDTHLDHDVFSLPFKTNNWMSESVFRDFIEKGYLDFVSRKFQLM